MYLLYSTLLAAALLFGSPYWLFQMLRHGKYRRGLGERFGVVPQRIRSERKPSIWIHAVSVGEVLAVSELVRQLRSEYREHRVLVSTTTDTGQTLATTRFGAENVFYFPFDFEFCVKPYFDALHPELIVIAETEFWPNFLRTAHTRGVPVAIVNARISDRSLPGYRRWQRLLSRVLTNVDLFLAQTPEDARRLTEIGADANRVRVGGNLKFDVPPQPVPAIISQLQSVLAASGASPVLVCGSTVDGEEPLLIEAFKAVLARHSSAVMLLAPRHPERFQQVADQLQQSGIKFSKRSSWNGEPLAGGVLLIDSIGELASLYALADVAFVGGSLVPRGGHSILEPAQYGVAILVGPHTENFRDIIELFRSQDAIRIVSPADFNRVLIDLLANEAERIALGRRALETLHSQRGATQLTMDQLRGLLKSSVREVHPS
jgi:3-deoxy-D-manno-octulosonic-acid transferase